MPDGTSQPGTGKSVKAPAVATRPTRSVVHSVNQSAPSGPVVMALDPLPAVPPPPRGVPVVLIFVTPPSLVTQRFPSGPTVIPLAPARGAICVVAPGAVALRVATPAALVTKRVFPMAAMLFGEAPVA